MLRIRTVSDFNFLVSWKICMHKMKFLWIEPKYGHEILCVSYLPSLHSLKGSHTKYLTSFVIKQSSVEWSFLLRWHISTWEVPGFRAFWFQIFRLGILGQYFKGMHHGTSFSVLLLYVKHVFILPFFPTKHMVPCFLHNSKTLGRGRGSARVRYLPLFVSSVFLISSHHRILHKRVSPRSAPCSSEMLFFLHASQWHWWKGEGRQT